MSPKESKKKQEDKKVIAYIQEEPSKIESENITKEQKQKNQELFNLHFFSKLNILAKLRLVVITMFILSTLSMVLIFVTAFIIPAILIILAYIMMFVLMVKLLMIKHL